MRPRFSLRWLLGAVTLASVFLYLLFVRPTVVAQRFVDSVNQADYHELARLTLNGAPLKARLEGIAPRVTYSSTNLKATASLDPRTWRDVWRFQRIVRVEVSAREDASRLRYRWSSLATVVVKLTSVEMREGFSSPELRAPDS